MIVATSRAAAVRVYWNCATAFHQPHSEAEARRAKNTLRVIAQGLFNSDSTLLTRAAQRDMALSTSQTTGQPCEVIPLRRPA